MSSLINELQRKSATLSKGQKRIASFILEQHEKAAFMTAAELGAACGVSESTVVRFAYALDMNGYPALQKSMEEMVLSKLTSVERVRLAEEIPSDDVFKTVLSNDINSLRQTLEMTDPHTFSLAADKIVSARRVGILGLRSALPLAQFLAYYLDYIRGNVVNYSTSRDTLKEDMLRLEREDVLVCISFPRYSARTVEAVRLAKDRGAFLIALTDKLDSPIGNVSDLTLLAKSDMASFADSLTAPLSVINALITAVGQRSRPEFKHHLQELENMWDSDNVYFTDFGGTR